MLGMRHSAAAATPPECWTRLEVSEHRFVEEGAEHTDGVVIALRFDTPSSRALADPPGAVVDSQLKSAALAARMPFLIDLETWRLPYLSDREDKAFKRDAATIMAQAVPLPLTAEALGDDESLLQLVRAGIIAQVGAEVTFAPDFQFQSLRDPWLEVNLRAVAMTRALAGARPIGAWVHVTLETMLSGVLPFLAARYAALLPAGSRVVLTVSDLQPTLTPEELAVYLGALASFEGAGLAVIVDRAGDASIPAVATFADGCILGTRIYRTAPPTPHFTSDFNPRVRLSYFVGAQGRRVRRDLARARHAAGRLPDCAHPGCEVVRSTGMKENIRLRLHSAHELRYAIQRARRLGLSALLAEWRDAKLKHLRCWAQAIELVSANREEA